MAHDTGISTSSAKASLPTLKYFITKKECIPLLNISTRGVYAVLTMSRIYFLKSLAINCRTFSEIMQGFDLGNFS